MNERIKELAEQAKGFVDLNQHVGGDKGCMVYTHDGLEQFAELIVKECAVVGSKAMYPDSDPDYVGRKINEHFGIEE